MSRLNDLKIAAEEFVTTGAQFSSAIINAESSEIRAWINDNGVDCCVREAREALLKAEHLIDPNYCDYCDQFTSTFFQINNDKNGIDYVCKKCSDKVSDDNIAREEATYQESEY